MSLAKSIPELVQESHKLATSCQNEVFEFFTNELKGAEVLSEKGKDLKLHADIKISEFLKRKLSLSGFSVLSEEDQNHLFYPNEYYWVIDPVDGSFNFSRGFPYYCCSIALVKGKTPLYGNILNLTDGTSIFGGETLPSGYKVNSNQDLTRAVLATGFPLGFDFEKDTASVLKFYSQFKKIRMIGSAASSLVQVSKGVFDLYYEKNIYFWDIAAGMAIVKSSEGDFSVSFVADSWKCNLLAGNKTLIDKIKL